MNAEFKAFVDAVRVNPRLMTEVGNKVKAILALNQLIESHADVDVLLEATFHYEFGTELFNIVAGRLRRTDRWWEFVDAAYSRRDHFISENVWDLKRFDELMGDPETIDYLIKHHRKVLFGDPYDDPAIRRPQEYWMWKVRWYIAKRDFLRAWDELKKASHGFYIGDESRPGRYQPDAYAYPANTWTIEALAHELYTVMQAHGLTPDPRQLPRESSSYTGTYTVTSRKGKTVDKKYSIHDSAAWQMASKFRNREAMRHDPRHVTLFSETGAMILEIDRHFRNLRNTDRNRRIREKVKQI